MSVIERLLPSVTDKPMTLGRALKLAESYHKQNRRVLLKRESVYYYSEFEWNSKGRLRDVNAEAVELGWKPEEKTSRQCAITVKGTAQDVDYLLRNWGE